MSDPRISDALAVSAVVLHDEPALKTVVDEERPWERDEVWDPSASYRCGMSHGTEHGGAVGWREHEYSDTYGADHITQEWVPFYEVRLPGDTEPTRFCEDCMSWLTTAADHIRVGLAAPPTA